MAAPVKATLKQVKPLLSLNPTDARRRALTLYKAWYRQIPYIKLGYDIPKTEEECKRKLKEEFRRNSTVRDLRVIDMLIIKGQMDLQEMAMLWKTNGSVMNYWKETWEPKPTDFMSKFLTGQE
ncbi:NADH dehydrogenase (ubiquinone) B14 subunit [Osmia lignaria lignaria]|uniref:NADH dehydrogenase [ubiquinone] 1 alpha subcomplex subunit 6 n=1 Tax=Osmia bicornis bicornis TaxID=1437191 RepID=UPI0010F48FBD|nr:NADH dehydrogenase [ubiquinone] 1 alpha subcomplex subunit 6 [Osmia bicornis bicornis]